MVHPGMILIISRPNRRMGGNEMNSYLDATLIMAMILVGVFVIERIIHLIVLYIALKKLSK